jgi:hypothetical protein
VCPRRATAGPIDHVAAEGGATNEMARQPATEPLAVIADSGEPSMAAGARTESATAAAQAATTRAIRAP